ncbi:lipopolysaccharide biosynthesis protein [Limnohabitans sp. MMS-10A-160]|uniref:lipopolysaccharide biosynthesis protein n=1 Tax=Limnohabitans sp. MMS-10A-160 TaxID=1835766 RepID=UPI0011B20798|nr:hypothetical protein [Limnohabitans sp. MMS-10A-160]
MRAGGRASESHQTLQRRNFALGKNATGRVFSVSLRRRWLGNSLVNMTGGLATAGVNVLLPAVVVHHLTAESFSVWNLALQMAVYVNLLSMGLQTATARAVAHAAEAGPSGQTRLPVIVHAARSIAQGASGVAVLMVALLVAFYPLMFPSVSPGMVSDFRFTLALFGAAAVTQIMAQVDMGVFQGLHRNSVFVGTQMLVRLLTVFAVWLAVQLQQPMVILAAVMAAATALLWPAMRTVFVRGLPWASEVATAVLDRACRRDLLHYCGSLSVWSVCMLLVNSAGIVLVGRMDFVMAGPYAIAMTAATVLVGLLGAVLSPLMTTAAALNANPETRSQLPALLTRSTLGVAVGLNLLALFVNVLHPWILSLWVGESFVSSTGPLLVVLVMAHCLRNIGAPYALMLLATGLHKRALISAVFEGVANLLASIVMGFYWGALGVAFGSLLGSLVGIVGMFAMNAHRTPELTPQPVRITFFAFVGPMLVFAPLHYVALERVLN